MKRKPLKPSDAGMTYGQDLLGNRICLGARRGMPDHLPEDAQVSLKFRMVRLLWIDGDYIPNGAYFGCLYHEERNTAGLLVGRGRPKDFIYYARADVEDGVPPELYIRAASRAHAKARLREKLPNATFWR